MVPVTFAAAQCKVKIQTISSVVFDEGELLHALSGRRFALLDEPLS
jgi:hypothetical protein